MSKKEQSSGTEKAEKLAKQSTTKKSNSSFSSKKNTPAQSRKAAVKPAEEETITLSAREQKKLKKQELKQDKKLKAAQLKAEKQQKRLEKKLEHKQKRAERIAALKEHRAERKEKRQERKDLLKAETREQRAERILEEKQAKREAKAAKRKAKAEALQAKREHHLALKAERRAKRAERNRTPGFGGWLAAVISLSVVTLALGTMVTFSWIGYNGIQADLATQQTESLYELNSVVDNLDANLAKARVSNSGEDQTNLFADIAVESEMAEMILERLPVETQSTQNICSFYNKMSDCMRSYLTKIANQEELSANDKASLAYMYQTNLALKQSMNELISTCTAQDIMASLSGKANNALFNTFDNIENNVIETPKEIHDGPFSETAEKVSAKSLEALEEISAPEAEKLAKEYFKSYKVTDAKCTGETTAKQLTCYNVQLETSDGQMFAQISKQGGKVVMFDSFKECSTHNFTIERCLTIAEDFLTSIGYENLKAVWSSESGTTCNLNFVAEQNDTILYPDMIKVKVCEERGIVTGIEALSYVLNHTERTFSEPQISLEEAQKAVSADLEMKGSRLTLIPYQGGEALAYEFYGTAEANDYYVYIDANTGKEIQIFTVIGTAQGRALL